jgi:hypothetical protein
MSELERAEWSHRVARLERRERRMTAIVVMLLLLTVTSTLWHLLPGAGVIEAGAISLQGKGSRFPRAAFYLGPDGLPVVRFNNARGEAIALWSLRGDGTSSFRLSDEHFITRIELNVDPAGWPSFALSAPNGHTARLWFDGGVARLDGVTPRTP